MGKQIRFYILPEDEQYFLDFVFQKPTVRLLRLSSNSPDFIIERNFLDINPTTPQICIWDSIFDLAENDIRKVFRNKYDENQGIYIETNEFYYVIDRFDAPIIEFSRSYFREDKKLLQGRIWAEMYRVENTKIIRKEHGFYSWYEELAQWIRRNWKRDKVLEAYVSKRADEWRNSGGEFQ